MNRYFSQKSKMSVLVILLTVGITLPTTRVMASIDSVADVKAAFDEAMGQSLQDRIPLLEALEEDIDQALFDNTLTGKDKTEGLYYKFHTQLQQAKYPDSYQTYADYIKNIKDVENVPAATAAFLRNITDWKRKRDYAYIAAVCDKMAEELAADPVLGSAALYYVAYSKFWLNGTMEECVQACNQLIGDYPDSRLRPQAMRTLANAYMSQGKHDDALQVLALLKQQYSGTQWEHYADMRPGIVYEVGKGDPQKALDVYQGSLARYSDHLYGPYIHKQIERLQKIIEEQLIQDALGDLAQAEKADCDSQSLIVRDSSQAGTPVALNY